MGIIKNYHQLATTETRRHLLDLIEAGITAVHPISLMENAVRYDPIFNSLTIHNRTYDIISGRIFVVGGGKAAGFMAEALERMIGPENITAGFLNCPDAGFRTKKIKIMRASHPLPDKNGVRGVEKMFALKEKYRIGPKDLVIFLLSGGASALLPAPAEGLTLADKQTVTRLLLESGATIREINAVRKHLSRVKGGQLARFFQPAQVAAIVISDVVGNDPRTIGSGPAAADPTTFQDAARIIEKYGLGGKLPPAAARHLELGLSGQREDTPKVLPNCENFVIGDVTIAMEAMAVAAKSFGYKPLIGSAEITGETEQVAIDKAFEVAANSFRGYNALIFGGETTPKLPSGHGRGGRNQHFAAVSMYALAKHYQGHYAMAAFATDGADYLPEAAGAVIDQSSLSKALAKKLPAEKLIASFDATALFEKMGENLIATGPTGTNVGDIALYLLA